MKVLFLFPYPSGTAASQRFRFEQYLGFLQEEGITCTLFPFLDEATWKILYKPGNTLRKAWGIVKGFLRRLRILFFVARYDFVFIHREATPIGPPVIEWIIAKLFRKRIIFDFDDAIWLPNTSENNKIAAKLKWHQKTASICRWAWKISAGNAYLAEYARQCRNAESSSNMSENTKSTSLKEEVELYSEIRNSHIIINPTTIDTTHLHNRLKDQHTHSFVIGWTGTHSTIQYLEPFIPILEKLEKEHDFTFLVISDRKPEFTLRSLQYIPWSKATEAEDLMRMNVGIMPLTDDLWAKGKCGFKALQYMALGIPALASPVGVNTEIIQNGVNGFLCQTSEDWENSILQLMKSPDLRSQLGKAARQRIEERYSIQANRFTFLTFFTA